MASSILAMIGISAEVWKTIPQEDRDRISQAVKTGSIDAAKKILRTLGYGNPASEIIEPIEGKRQRTTVNLLQTDVDALSEIAESKDLTKTHIIDTALSLAMSKFNETTTIDQMLKQTNNFWFNRDLDIVKQILPPEQAKTLTPHQKAYLYVNLRDSTDRQKVFEALDLLNDLDQINAMNLILEKASKFQDGQLLGYNINIIANEIRAKITPLQRKYCQFKLGSENLAKLEALTVDKFPKPAIFKEKESKSPEIELVE